MRTNLLLSICIPTFNRVDKVLYLLDIIKREIEGLEKDIEVIVSDNHTESGQLQKLVEYSKENTFFKLYLQKENTGFSGNYHFLIEKATGKYTWIFGDDDIITEGALRQIIGILKENVSKIGCLHLNYNHFINSVENVIPNNNDYGGNHGFISDVDAFLCKYSKKKAIGRFLFISANIMNSEVLKSRIIPQEKRDLCDCLYYALICSKYGLYIDDHITFTQNATKGAITWKKMQKDVNLYIVQAAIMSIPETYYSYDLKKQIVFNVYRKHYHCLFLLLGMTSNRNITFFKNLFTLSERFKIYTGGITYIFKKIYSKYLRITV